VITEGTAADRPLRLGSVAYVLMQSTGGDSSAQSCEAQVTDFEDRAVHALRVLVIEDDAAIAEMYRLRLLADGYAVAIAGDGQEGLQVATENVPDFVYLDLRLPGLDGFEVLEGLRATPTTKNIPVVIVSNYGDPELVERGLLLGAVEFLVKADTTPSTLSAVVERSTRTQAASLG
jgi:CheY-like chemotaxis protein